MSRMDLIPKRPSLVVQVAGILRQEMAKGRWKDYIPGQLSLCNLLQVSRSTLKAALSVLGREGLIKVSQGRRTRILRTRRVEPRSVATRTIMLLIPEPLFLCQATFLFICTQLEDHLQDAGLKLETLFDARLRAQHPHRYLETFVHHRRAVCWVLSKMNRAVEQWFMDQKKPALVWGVPHAGIRLPSFHLDQVAIGRHAAGQFLRLGHRRVALLIPRNANASDLACEKGFLEAFQTADRSDAFPSVVRHDGTVDGVCAALRSMFRSKTPVTGILVSHAKHVPIAVGHLLTSGLRLPQDVAVISREFEEFLAYQVPSIACYDFNLRRYATRLSQLVVALARTSWIPPRRTRIMTEFRTGQSFGPRQT